MNLWNATIGQLMIPVDDFDRGVSFYCVVLGLNSRIPASTTRSLPRQGYRLSSRDYLISKMIQPSQVAHAMSYMPGKMLAPLQGTSDGTEQGAVPARPADP